MQEKICAVILGRLSIFKIAYLKLLVNKFGSLDELLQLSLERLEQEIINIEGRELLICKSMREWAEEEVEWCNSKGVEILIKGRDGYPKMLNECDDAPVMLYYKGSINLSCVRCLSMVGTRLATNYGREMCKVVINDLVERGHYPTIVSGLAYGIDIASHKAALDAGLNSVAVIPCGIDEIYPSAHRGVAKELIKQGGVITEFHRGVKPHKYNFLRRNRIIAGVSEGVVLVESRIKGGAMITVELANSYSRDIFAVPARATDANSYGANYLISKSVATIYCNKSTIPTELHWEGYKWGEEISFQQQLFNSEFSFKERVVEEVKKCGIVSVDGLIDRLDANLENISLVLLELELEGIIVQNGGFYNLK